MTKKTYVFSLLIGTLLIFLILPVFNYTNDQWRVFNSDYYHYHKGTEPNKTFLKTKYLVENKTKYHTLLMGSSRIAFLDESKFGDAAYNMTYSFGQIKTHFHNLNILLNEGMKVKKIILGIDDFYIFANPDELDSDYLRKTYETDLFEKIKFYKFYLFKKPSERDLDIFLGKYPLIENDLITQNNMKNKRKMEQRIRANAKKHIQNIKDQPPLLLGYRENFRVEQVLEEIKQFKRLCDSNQIELTVYFNPTYFTTYLAYNQFEIEKFKKGLVEITEFYDFYVLNPYAFNELNWFDTSHYLASVGDKIIDDIMHQRAPVTKGSIDRHLKEARRKTGYIFEKEIGRIVTINHAIPLPDKKTVFDTNGLEIGLSGYGEVEAIKTTEGIRLDITDIDRFFVLNALKIGSKNGIVSCSVESPKETTLRIFYPSKGGVLASYDVAIKKGDNRFNLLVPSKYLNTGLQIAFASDQGTYLIKKFEIYAK